jgi:hypothetical protein
VAKGLLMSKRTGVKTGTAENGDPGFLSRWSARKAEIARAGAVRDEDTDEQNEANAANAAGTDKESDEEAVLSDDELLEKYELPDPNDITEEAGLDRFFDGEIPERLRQMALRRLWRINPFFGIVDDMVEYGEDYTDAATVIDGMQTAYQAGKGYLKKAISPEEADEAVETQTDDVGATEPLSDTEQTDADEVELEPAGNSVDQSSETVNESETTGPSMDVKDTTETIAGGADNDFLNAVPSMDSNFGEQTILHDDDLSQSKSDISTEGPGAVSTAEQTKAPQPKRMIFKIKTDN